MLKFTLSIITAALLYLGIYYGNSEVVEITYYGKTQIYTSGDGVNVILKTDKDFMITDNQDLLAGKYKSFSDSMQVGNKYKIQIVGWDNFIFGPKNAISLIRK